jgi:predicted RNA-binding Zn-ribbon protein involved in translation (DUF1610 family)
MVLHEFIPYVTEEILVKFECEKCGESIEESIGVPFPRMEGDRAGVDDEIDGDSILCPKCGEEFEYSITSYGHLQFDGFPDDFQIDFQDISGKD